CSGPSGDSAAMVRLHYSNEVSIRLAQKSLEIFQHFPERFDGADVFTPAGWLFLCPPEAAPVFQEDMARLGRLGGRTWELSVEEAARELPGLNPDGIGCVACEPDSGYADPRGMTEAFVARACANGAEAHV